MTLEEAVQQAVNNNTKLDTASLSSLIQKQGAFSDDETKALLNTIAPGGSANSATIQRVSIGGRGAGTNWYINGKIVDGGLAAAQAWAAKNGYTLPSDTKTGFNNREVYTLQQDASKTAWYNDVKNRTDKGNMFLDFAYQVSNTPALAESLANSQIGSNGQRMTDWGSNSAIIWETVNRATEKGYPTFQALQEAGTPIDLGTTYAGHGATNFSINFANGTPYVSTGWKDTSEAGTFAPLLALGSMFIAPGLAGALGGGVTGAAGAGAILGGANAAITGGDVLQGAALGGLTGGALQGVSEFVAPEIANVFGDSTLGNALTGATTGALKSAITGGDVLQGALTGGVMSAAPSIGSEIAPDASATTQSMIGNALAGGALAGIQGGDVLQSALLSGALAGLTTPTTTTPAESYDYASDAAQLAEQGLSSSQITDILGASGAPADMASSIGSYATNALAQGLFGDAAVNYINNNITADVQFSAADANQLFGQGLSNAQVGQVLDATKMGNTFSSLGQDASFIAADAQQLYNQTNNVAAVEQNLVASGVDPIVAAEVSNQVAFGAPTNEITDALLSASDPATLTTDNTLFSQDSGLPTENPLSVIKPSVVTPTQTIPTVQAGQQQQQSSNVDDSLFLLDRSRYGNLNNPFLRNPSNYKSMIASIFNG